MYQKDSEPGLLAGREAFAAQELFLEGGEEALGEGVVPGVADRAHREVDSGLLGVGAVPGDVDGPEQGFYPLQPPHH